MKRCPYCGRENEDAAVRCDGCGTDFPGSRSIDPELIDPKENLVVVASFGDTTEASLLKARLEQAGIEACIPEELDPSPFGNFKPLANVTVRVAKKDLASAKEVLAAPVPPIEPDAPTNLA